MNLLLSRKRQREPVDEESPPPRETDGLFVLKDHSLDSISAVEYEFIIIQVASF